ncbi:MAG: hypothetical protein ACHP7O_14515 [Burkholderiales bacterium]
MSKPYAMDAAASSSRSTALLPAVRDASACHDGIHRAAVRRVPG